MTKMKDTLERSKIPKVVNMISTQMHKKLGVPAHNPEIERQVEEFIRLRGDHHCT